MDKGTYSGYRVLYLRMTDDREGGGEMISRLQCWGEREVCREARFCSMCRPGQASLDSRYISGAQLNFPLNEFYPRVYSDGKARKDKEGCEC